MAADESTISWGPSPTFGELVRLCPPPELPRRHVLIPLCLQGYGDNKPKSSTTAQEVKTLDGVYVEQVRTTPEGPTSDAPQHIDIWCFILESSLVLKCLYT